MQYAMIQFEDSRRLQINVIHQNWIMRRDYQNPMNYLEGYQMMQCLYELKKRFVRHNLQKDSKWCNPLK